MSTSINTYLPSSTFIIPEQFAEKTVPIPESLTGKLEFPDWEIIADRQCWDDETEWSGLVYPDGQQYFTVVKDEKYKFEIKGLDGVPRYTSSITSAYFAVKPFCNRDRHMWIKADGLIETVNNTYDSVTVQQWYKDPHMDRPWYMQDGFTDNTPLGRKATRPTWVDTRWEEVTHTNMNPLNNGAQIVKNNAYVQAVGDEWDKSMYETTYNKETGEWEPPEPRWENDAGDRVVTNRQKVTMVPRACPYIFRVLFNTLDGQHQLGGRIYLNFSCEIEEP